MTREERQRARLACARYPACNRALTADTIAALDLLDRIERILGEEFVTDYCKDCQHRSVTCEDRPDDRSVCRIGHIRKAMEGNA